MSSQQEQIIINNKKGSSSANQQQQQQQQNDEDDDEDFRLSDDGEATTNGFPVPVLQLGKSDNNHHFMSEPSASEDADDSDRIRTRSIPPRPRFLSGSSDDEHAQQHFVPLYPTSPGNTSISSWDSPAMAKRKVLLQWPVPVRRNRIDRLSRYDGRHLARDSDAYPSISPHTHDSGQEDSDDDLRRSQSKGGSHSSSAGDAPLKRSDSSLTEEDRRLFLQDTDSIFRFLQSSYSPKSHHRTASVPQIRQLQDPTSVNDSLNMTFSDSDEAHESSSVPLLNTNNPRPNKRRKDSSEAHNSADDEKTVQRPPRVRGIARPIHRRTRSGDGAAAKLVRHGIVDWKGMEQDRIPMPDVVDDEDDDEEKGLLSRRLHRIIRQPPEAPFRKERSKEGYNQRKVGPFVPTRGDESPPQPPPSKRNDSKKAWLMQMANLDVSNSSVDPVILKAKDRDLTSNNQARTQKIVHGNRRDHTKPMANSNYVSTARPNRFNQLDNRQLDRLEKPHTEGKSGFQRVVQHFNETSPFANFGKAVPKTPRASFRPPFLSAEHDPDKVPTFVCPRCGTRQREFFSVADAPEMMRGPASYLAAYFTIYVIASLFIFGLEEGWDPLDCIYFAVVTLTTAGLGDNVPTSDANKIICSIFIFFGVSCIGLLLGSYIAGILDERARIDRKSKLADSCPNCARLRTIKDVVNYVPQSFGLQHTNMHDHHHYQTERASTDSHKRNQPAVQMMRRENQPHRHGQYSREATKISSPSHSTGSPSLSHASAECHTPSPVPKEEVCKSFGVNFPDNLPGSDQPSPPFAQVQTQNSRDELLGSPVTRQILGRQKHTRHYSFDLNEDRLGSAQSNSRPRRKGDESKTHISESVPLRTFNRSSSRYGSVESDYATSDAHYSGSESDDEGSDDASTSSDSSLEEVFDENLTKLKTAKYVFVTLRQALVNSMTIIAAGSLGFYFIEKWSMIDSWYFTTVFLTTVGYGDIVPITKGGKLFATVYILVAGTILLNNMSAISLIPLELRKRRLERAVLMQFGDQLDDAALRELATGPVIQRLRLAGNNPLDECTREMFSLAMLVRMGKVNEEEILHTFAAFKRLDVVNEGVLNSRSIIAGMVQKRRNFASRSKSMPVAPCSDHEEDEEEDERIPPAPFHPPDGPLNQRSYSYSPHTRNSVPLATWSTGTHLTGYHSD